MDNDRIYTTYDVAHLFRVTPATVRRWANEGRLGDEIRTPGGQRRYRADHVDMLLGNFRRGEDSLPPPRA